MVMCVGGGYVLVVSQNGKYSHLREMEGTSFGDATRIKAVLSKEPKFTAGANVQQCTKHTKGLPPWVVISCKTFERKTKRHIRCVKAKFSVSDSRSKLRLVEHNPTIANTGQRSLVVMIHRAARRHHAMLAAQKQRATDATI